LGFFGTAHGGCTTSKDGLNKLNRSTMKMLLFGWVVERADVESYES
jgi:hypothetical protein